MNKAIAVCILMLPLVATLQAQDAAQPEVKSLNLTFQAGDLMALNVADIEAEIDYSDRPLATVIVGRCEAINWSYKADWQDGEVTAPSFDNTASHINDKGYRLRNLGTYSLSFKHIYQVAKTKPGYTVVLHNDGQCAGFNYPNGVFNDTFSQELRVWGRIPVHSVTVTPATAMPGQVVTVDIQLESGAPASGTRVFLAFPNKVFGNAPDFLVVPPGVSKIDPTFTILSNAPHGSHKVGAWTAKTQMAHPPSGSLTIK